MSVEHIFSLQYVRNLVTLSTHTKVGGITCFGTGNLVGTCMIWIAEENGPYSTFCPDFIVYSSTVVSPELRRDATGIQPWHNVQPPGHHRGQPG